MTYRQRTLFENWVSAQTEYPFPLCIELQADGDYSYQDTRLAWMVWQAAWEMAKGEKE